MRNLVKNYPAEFPSGLAEKVDRDIGRLNSNYNTFNRLSFGTIIYWVLCRRAKWFKLTGNPFLRFGFLMINASSMMDVTIARQDYIRNTVASNAQSFEKLIHGRGINPDQMDLKQLVGM